MDECLRHMHDAMHGHACVYILNKKHLGGKKVQGQSEAALQTGSYSGSKNFDTKKLAT